MAAFFQENIIKCTSKILKIVKIFIIILMLYFLLKSIFNQFDRYYLIWLFLLSTILSLIDVVVSYLNKADKKVIHSEIVNTLFWLFLLFLFVLIGIK